MTFVFIFLLYYTHVSYNIFLQADGYAYASPPSTAGGISFILTIPKPTSQVAPCSCTVIGTIGTVCN